VSELAGSQDYNSERGRILKRRQRSRRNFFPLGELGEEIF
jgi:hypothetical protein